MIRIWPPLQSLRQSCPHLWKQPIVPDYVKFLRETSPYINLHRGKIFVLAISGAGVRHANFTNIVHDIALLHSLGVRLVLVHGARPQVDDLMTERGLSPQFSDVSRITDAAALACVKQAVGSTRLDIEARLSMDLANSPMQGARIRVSNGNFITAKPLGVRNGVDFCHTGAVRRVDRDSILHHINSGSLTLISPIGFSPTGEAFNLTYEEVATEVAIALQADKLLLLDDTDGVADHSGTLLRTISLQDTSRWLQELPEGSSQWRQLNAARRACLNGVNRAHLVTYTCDEALLRELFTRIGSGTLVSRDNAEVIRAATINDVGGIFELITPLEEQGLLVKRSRELLEMEINRFSVMVHTEGMLIACAALYPFPDGQSGELACVATHPDFHRQGLASRLLEHIEQQAREQGLERLFVLSTQTGHWFREKGFVDSSLEELPESKKSLYNYQRKSRIFVKPLV